MVLDDPAQALRGERRSRRPCDPRIDRRVSAPRDVDRAERRGERDARAFTDRELEPGGPDDREDGDRVVDDPRRGAREPRSSREAREIGPGRTHVREGGAGRRAERDECRPEAERPGLDVAHDVPGIGEREEDRMTGRLAQVGVAGELGEAEPAARPGTRPGTQGLEQTHDPLGWLRPLTRHSLGY